MTKVITEAVMIDEILIINIILIARINNEYNNK